MHVTTCIIWTLNFPQTAIHISVCCFLKCSSWPLPSHIVLSFHSRLRGSEPEDLNEVDASLRIVISSPDKESFEICATTATNGQCISCEWGHWSVLDQNATDVPTGCVNLYNASLEHDTGTDRHCVYAGSVSGNWRWGRGQRGGKSIEKSWAEMVVLRCCPTAHTDRHTRPGAT